MKLLVNTASTFKGGGVQVAKSFLEECRNFRGNEYHVILGKMLNDLLIREEFPENFQFYPINYRPATRVFSFKNRVKFFYDLEESLQPDVVFTTSGPAYWRPKSPHLVGYNLPHYIYRDSPYFKKLSILNRVKWDLKGEIIRRYFKNDADAYVVQTDDVKERLKKWIKSDQVYTVTNACSNTYINPVKFGNKLPEKSKDEFRFLTLSAWYEHKNLNIVPKIVNVLKSAINKKITFVLTLPTNDFNQHFKNQNQRSIINIGPVKPEEGPSLYNECDALFLPSLLECFSASYAEAMAMRKPIVTTDLGFARSICQDAAVYYKATDPNEAATKMEKLVEDENLRKRLVEAGDKQLKTFDTSKERAQKYLKICTDIISG